ncbi:MAG: hypothetical protein U0176_09515 [Bacteroidia bacterium]
MRNMLKFVPVVVFVGIMAYGIVEVARLKSDVYWMPIGIIGTVFSIIYISIFAPMVRNRRILRIGEPGTARVLRMFETGVTVNNNPMVKLELEVTPQRGATYTTMTRVIVSRLNPMMYGPGSVLSVKIDPQDRMQVVIDPNVPSSMNSGYGMAQATTVDSSVIQRRNEAMTEMMTKADKVRAELLESGRDCEGTILSLWSLDVTINGIATGMEFLVEVEIPGKAPFRTEIKGAVANANLQKYQIGTRVKLKYDPSDPERRVTVAGVV